MRIRRVFRDLCCPRMSGHSYLALGGFVAALAVAIPVMGPTVGPIIVAVAALAAGLFIVTIVGIFIAPAIL